jgi:hypothetical protein
VLKILSLMPVTHTCILATQVAETRRIVVSSWDNIQIYLTEERADGMTSVYSTASHA